MLLLRQVFKYGPHILVPTFSLTYLLRQVYKNGPEYLVHTFALVVVSETSVKRWPTHFGPYFLTNLSIETILVLTFALEVGQETSV